MPRILSDETEKKIRGLCGRYPTSAAALVPALHMVQDQIGYVPVEAQLDVAELLDVPPTRVREVVTFYTMFYDKPVGRHVVKICRNLACQLRGSDKITARAEELLGIEVGQTTADGRVTLEHDECLASCGTAPALWCDDGIVENLSEDTLEQFLAGLK